MLNANHNDLALWKSLIILPWVLIWDSKDTFSIKFGLVTFPERTSAVADGMDHPRKLARVRVKQQGCTISGAGSRRHRVVQTERCRKHRWSCSPEPDGAPRKPATRSTKRKSVNARRVCGWHADRYHKCDALWKPRTDGAGKSVIREARPIEKEMFQS